MVAFFMYVTDADFVSILPFQTRLPIEPNECRYMARTGREGMR